MGDILFQITLALTGALVGALAQLVDKRRRLLVVLILAWLLSSFVFMWLGYEIGLSF